MTVKQRGLFITFEGPEGSGKSTQARRLARWLRARGRRVLLTHEPGGTALGRSVRRLLLHRRMLALTPMTEVWLFMASRAQLVTDVIAPALRRGTIVICDRFLDSTLAYQGGGSGVSLSLIRQAGHAATGGMQPDVTFLLDVPVRTGLGRRGRRRDRIESKALQYHERVRRQYLALARTELRRILRLDGTQSKQALEAYVRTVVARRCGLRSA